MVFVLLLLCAPVAWAQESTIVQKRSIDRTLREYLFLSGQMRLQHRNVVYAEDAAPGPGARNDLRFYLNGRGQSSMNGPLSAYVGLGLVLRPTTDVLGDPIADAYDDFQARRNIRIFGAHAEWAHRDENQQERFTIRLGRMSDYDVRARLLIYDGLFARLRVGDNTAVSVFGGRRSILDGELPDDRRSALAQLTAGATVDLRFDALDLRAGYRLEELHRALLEVGYAPDLFSIRLGGEVLLGGRDATTEGELAAVVYATGDWFPQPETNLTGFFELQIGEDPRTYGRGGIGPTQAEIEVAASRPVSAGRLDRIFLGAEQPHVLGELLFEQWVASTIALHVGAFGRMPLSSADLRSLQPATIEAWAGPELLLPSGYRAAAEVRLAFEDPGDPDRIFAFAGDGVRRYGSLRLHGEVPIPFNDSWALSLRPDVEGFYFTTEGPLSRAENQLGFAAGLLAAVKAGNSFSVAVRYGLSALPEFGSDGVDAIHLAELWLGGSY